MAIVSPLERPDYRVRLRPFATLRALGPRGVLRVLARERIGADGVDYRVRPRGFPAPLAVRPRTSDWYSLHQVFVERPYEAAAIGRPLVLALFFLERSLLGFLAFYNFDRPHHGYRVRGRTPATLFHGAVAAS